MDPRSHCAQPRRVARVHKGEKKAYAQHRPCQCTLPPGRKQYVPSRLPSVLRCRAGVCLLRPRSEDLPAIPKLIGCRRCAGLKTKKVGESRILGARAKRAGAGRANATSSTAARCSCFCAPLQFTLQRAPSRFRTSSMIIVQRPRFSLLVVQCQLTRTACCRPLRPPASCARPRRRRCCCAAARRARRRSTASGQLAPGSACHVAACLVVTAVLGLEEGRRYGRPPWPARPPTVPLSRAAPPAMQRSLYAARLIRTAPAAHTRIRHVAALPPAAVHLAPAYPFPACPCLLPGPCLAPAIPSGPSGPSRFGLLSQQRFLLKRPPPPFSFPGGVLW